LLLYSSYLPLGVPNWPVIHRTISSNQTSITEREAVAGGGGGLAHDGLCGSNLEHGMLVAAVWGEQCGNSKGTQTGWRWGRAVLSVLAPKIGESLDQVGRLRW
jgi:hypothetical protein